MTNQTQNQTKNFEFFVDSSVLKEYVHFATKIVDKMHEKYQRVCITFDDYGNARLVVCSGFMIVSHRIIGDSDYLRDYANSWYSIDSNALKQALAIKKNFVRFELSIEVNEHNEMLDTGSLVLDGTINSTVEKLSHTGLISRLIKSNYQVKPNWLDCQIVSQFLKIGNSFLKNKKQGNVISMLTSEESATSIVFMNIDELKAKGLYAIIAPYSVKEENSVAFKDGLVRPNELKQVA